MLCSVMYDVYMTITLTQTQYDLMLACVSESSRIAACSTDSELHSDVVSLNRVLYTQAATHDSKYVQRSRFDNATVTRDVSY